MTRLKRLIAFSVLFILGGMAFAQHSLFDNPNFKQAQELRRQADVAFQQGDYLRAEELSKESERLSIIANNEAETQRLQWIANGWRNRASDRIAFGEKNNAAGQLGSVWVEAKAAFALAVAEYDSKRYAESTEASKKTLDLMKDFTAATAAPTLPASYVVRLIPARRDSFWRIAEYPFVYGDPWKWKVLYEANRHKLPQPNNPDLILPGMVIDIPSIKGETRSGNWNDK
ncbi:MAG TPA: hypothetical protein DCG47_02810 [Spirochaetaceae bacterium]|jgi:nucleoid-associated protein YgaU|nr:hypothetical protein [Spirochaetaceae bacterium]